MMSDDRQRNEVLTIQAMDGQYLIESSSERSDVAPPSVDGLTMGEAGWTSVLTGAEYGPIEVAVQVLGGHPRGVEPGWDMVAERDINVESTGNNIWRSVLFYSGN